MYKGYCFNNKREWLSVILSDDYDTLEIKNKSYIKHFKNDKKNVPGCDMIFIVDLTGKLVAVV